ncbi:MAG: hypothetical protein KDH89_06325, partial [Anaerolineae bacterium]|nr:hypothetical protein [Anaerolineae bacterium]
ASSLTRRLSTVHEPAAVRAIRSAISYRICVRTRPSRTTDWSPPAISMSAVVVRNPCSSASRSYTCQTTSAFDSLTVDTRIISLPPEWNNVVDVFIIAQDGPRGKQTAHCH